MTTILYIILGISIGVGCTLIFLQGRFIRERLFVVAASQSERQKSAEQLKELDEQWELECAHYKQEVAAMQDEAAHGGDEVKGLEEALLKKEALLTELTIEQEQLRESIAVIQGQFAELQSESDVLKGEVDRLEEEKKNLPDDDYTIFYITDVSGHGAASAFVTFLNFPE